MICYTSSILGACHQLEHHLEWSFLLARARALAVKRAIMGDCSNDTSHALAAVAASLSEAPASAQEPEAAALPSSDSPAAEEWYEVPEEPPSPTVSSSSPSSPTE